MTPLQTTTTPDLLTELFSRYDAGLVVVLGHVPGNPKVTGHWMWHHGHLFVLLGMTGYAAAILQTALLNAPKLDPEGKGPSDG